MNKYHRTTCKIHYLNRTQLRASANDKSLTAGPLFMGRLIINLEDIDADNSLVCII